MSHDIEALKRLNAAVDVARASGNELRIERARNSRYSWLEDNVLAHLAALERGEKLEEGLDGLAKALLPWPLQDGESAFDMAARILRRAERVEAAAQAVVDDHDPEPWAAEVFDKYPEFASMRRRYELLAALRAALAAVPDPGWKLSGADLIAAERRRQVAVEGWTPDHDDEHRRGEIADAAVCYAMAAVTALYVEDIREHYGSASDGGYGLPARWKWPFEAAAWKPSSDPIRNLEKAGALIAAEIDRLRRAGPASGEEEGDGG